MGGSTAAGPRLCWLIFFGLLMYIRILHHNPCSLVGSFRQAEVARALLQSEIDMLQEATEVSMKMGLRNQQEMRRLLGTAWDTYLGPAGSKPVVAANKAGDEFNEAVQKQGSADLHPPHTYIVMDFLEALTREAAPEEGEEGAEGTAEVELLDKVLQELAIGGGEMVDEVLPYFRVQDTFKEDVVKIQVCWNPIASWKVEGSDLQGPMLTCAARLAFHRLLVQAKYVKQLGSAPAGELERVAGRLLKKLQASRT